MATLDHLHLIEAGTVGIAAAARSAPLTTPVPSCPRWDLGRLVGHLGRVQRWATAVVEAGGEVDTGALERPPGGPEVVPWMEAGTPALVAALRRVDPDQPLWNFSSGPKVAGFWSRRQSHEATIHRWDAEAAVGPPTPMTPEVAADAIDEMLHLMVPRLFASGPVEGLAGSLHVHCTDTAGEWLAVLRPEGVEITREHAKGDAALRGPAAAVLLVLSNRLPPDTDGVEVIGDRAVLQRWERSIKL